MEDPEETQRNYATVLAALATIGGVDERVRLGGVVQHSECGACTVASIAASGKIVVQTHDSGERKICRLSDITVVNIYFFTSS